MMAETQTTSGKGFLIGALLLVLGLGAFGAYQIYSVWKSPTQAVARLETSPEQLIHLWKSPQAAFPSAIAWGPLLQLSDALPSPPGFEIRYTATRVLASRGSPRIPLDILREMIDEERQMRNFRVQLKDGKVVPNQGEAWEVVLIGLKAISEWHRHPGAVKSVGNSQQLQDLYRSIEKLTKSPSQTVRTHAENVRLALKER